MRGLSRILVALVVAVSQLPAAAGAVDIKAVTTPLGITAWLVQDKSAPAVSLSFSFAGGTASDPEGQLGVTTLMATLLSDGAGTLTSQAFRQSQQGSALRHRPLDHDGARLGRRLPLGRQGRRRAGWQGAEGAVEQAGEIGLLDVAHRRDDQAVADQEGRGAPRPSPRSTRPPSVPPRSPGAR